VDYSQSCDTALSAASASHFILRRTFLIISAAR
jgi:hypothetical protein